MRKRHSKAPALPMMLANAIMRDRAHLMDPVMVFPLFY
jgi:hypothetical protein